MSADNEVWPSDVLRFSLGDSIVHAVSRLVDDWQDPRSRCTPTSAPSPGRTTTKFATDSLLR